MELCISQGCSWRRCVFLCHYFIVFYCYFNVNILYSNIENLNAKKTPFDGAQGNWNWSCLDPSTRWMGIQGTRLGSCVPERIDIQFCQGTAKRFSGVNDPNDFLRT